MVRTCNLPGCSRALVARGMCGPHYRAALAANPRLRMMTQTRTAILAAMPATQAAITTATGFCPETVRRVLDELHNDEKIHVWKFNRPTYNGTKFMPVFKAGPGVDAVVTDKMRDRQRRKTMREGYHRRKDVEQATKAARAVVVQHGWAASLMAGL